MTLGATFLALCCTESKTENSKDYRNIVFIIGDDHANHTLGCYGNDIIRTPNLDQLASKGVRFTRAYANSPICSASRQSILTGRYPHAAGVTLLSTPFPEEQLTIADHLVKHGYETAVIGKTHFNNNLSHGFKHVLGKDYKSYLDSVEPPPVPDSIMVRPAWNLKAPASEWLNAESATSGRWNKHDQGTYYANQTVKFINKYKDDKMCVWVGFHEPHSPFNFPIEYQGKYDPDKLPLPTGSPEDNRWIPEIFRDLTEEQKRGIIRSYYTSVEYLDKNVGIILDGIKEAGIEDNTLIVYIGDHGYLLNHHKRFEKHSMWKEAVRSPLIINGFGEGRVIDEMVEYVDLVPTLLDIINVQSMNTVQGESMYPLLTGKTQHHKDFVFSEFIPDNKAMVCTERWKLIFTSGKKDLALGYQTGYGPSGLLYKLYDQRNDPRETTNLAKQKNYESVKDSLTNIMLQVFRETHPKADSIPKNLPVNKQLSKFCEPIDVGHKGY
jgi:choline-sulfatase